MPQANVGHLYTIFTSSCQERTGGFTCGGQHGDSCSVRLLASGRWEMQIEFASLCRRVHYRGSSHRYLSSWHPGASSLAGRAPPRHRPYCCNASQHIWPMLLSKLLRRLSGMFSTCIDNGALPFLGQPKMDSWHTVASPDQLQEGGISLAMQALHACMASGQGLYAVLARSALPDKAYAAGLGHLNASGRNLRRRQRCVIGVIKRH